MQRIESFLAGIDSARKRTGILYATEDFEAVVKYCVRNGYVLVETASQYAGTIILKDDELIARMKLGAQSKPLLHIGVEAFVGPRFNDAGFVEQLIRKLMVEEPPNPIVLLLYSRKLFQLFSKLYSSYLTNQIHVLDLTAEQPTDNDDAQ